MPDETITSHERVALCGWYDEINDSVRALLFGEMVKRTIGVVENYHSDLFRDAQWITEHVKDAMVFYWAPRTYGTNIGTDIDLVTMPSLGLTPYHVRLENVRGYWSVTFHQL